MPEADGGAQGMKPITNYEWSLLSALVKIYRHDNEGGWPAQKISAYNKRELRKHDLIETIEGRLFATLKGVRIVKATARFLREEIGDPS
jgi:hypothetical protein